MYLFAYFFVDLLVIALIIFAMRYFGVRKLAMIMAGVILLLVSAIVYFAFLENYLTRNYGGKMIIKLPENAQMIAMTWKDSSLWYHYYLPDTNECVFREDSPVGMLQGEVRTPNCNPLGVSK